MGCTASTPANARFAGEPALDTKERLPQDSTHLIDTPEASNKDEKPLAATVSSGTSIAADNVRQASSTRLAEVAIPNEVASIQPEMTKQVEHPESITQEKPPRPPAREEQQPPMKRVAINDDKSAIIPKLMDSGSGTEPLNAERRVEEYYNVDRSRRIGKGHYASVFIGVNRSTGQKVAVKMIDKRLSKSERLALEVNVMRKAGAHPHIVQLIDVFETDTHLQLILELVEGGELFEHLVEHGPYSEATAAMHIRDVTRAIAFLHSQNIIHRDLKPENILLTTKDDDARVKVADFGLAKLMFADVTRTVCGTWAYCAYEVKKPGGAYDNKCDVWSIGVIAYILLSAYHPFDPLGDATDDEIWEKISRCDYNFNDPAWDNVSDSAKDFVSRLLVHDPKQRMSAEEALQHPWLQALDDTVEPDSLPALSPRINDKLASYQKRAAMNPLQRAAAAMRSRVSNWKSSTANTGSMKEGGGGSPSWARRNFAVAAAAAAAAARAASRKGPSSSPSNAESLKTRTWSMGSSGRNMNSAAGSTHSSASPVHNGSAAETFNETQSNSTANNHQPLVPSPLRTTELAPQPTDETLLVPATPNVANLLGTEEPDKSAGIQHAFDEVPFHSFRNSIEDVPNSPINVIAALRVAETGDDVTVRSSDLDTISSEDEDDLEENTDGEADEPRDEDDNTDGHFTASFASGRTDHDLGYESFKTATGGEDNDARSVEDV